MFNYYECSVVHTLTFITVWRFFASCISSEPRAAHFRPAF